MFVVGEGVNVEVRHQPHVCTHRLGLLPSVYTCIQYVSLQYAGSSTVRISPTSCKPYSYSVKGVQEKIFFLIFFMG